MNGLVPTVYDDDLLYDLNDHPEHARLIGQITASWSIVEWQLGMLYGWLMRAPPWHSQTTFYSLHNNKARRDLIRNLAKKITDKKIQKKINADLLDKVSKAAKIRNTYCHDRWSRKGDDVFQHSSIALHFPHGRRKIIHLKDLEQALNFMRLTASELSQFTKENSEKNPIIVHGSELIPNSR